jgi:N-acetylglucosamine kinase-like BadF-type ATPase
VTSPIYAGVDGGGTKTVAWLAPRKATQQPGVLGRGYAGTGNPRAAGFEVCLRNLDAAIAAAFHDAGLPRETIAAACFGLAGAGRTAEQERIAAWARQVGVAEAVVVTGDAEPILAAGSPSHCGIAVICGTGSFAWGRSANGETARSGGWGYLFGDEGSAYSIAVEGLRAAARAADGRGPATALVEKLQHALNAATPQEIVERIYHPEMTRAAVAALASLVFEAAEFDQIAAEIVASAANQLVEMVTNIHRRLHFSAGAYALAMTGGVLLSQRTFRERFRAELRQLGIEPQTITLVEEPVRGAIAMARSLRSD